MKKNENRKKKLHFWTSHKKVLPRHFELKKDKNRKKKTDLKKKTERKITSVFRTSQKKGETEKENKDKEKAQKKKKAKGNYISVFSNLKRSCSVFVNIWTRNKKGFSSSNKPRKKSLIDLEKDKNEFFQKADSFFLISLAFFLSFN